MSALFFLSWRSIVNGIRRAVTSWKRLIGLIVILLYYGQFLLRPFVSHYQVPAGPHGFVQFQPETLRSAMFILFVVVFAAVTLSAVSPRGGFRQADVDVLFPTPVSPRVVLFYRILRDYLVALLFPVVLALLSGGSGIQGVVALFRGFPEQGAIAGKLFTADYLLVSLACVTGTFALGLYINRNDEESARRKQLFQKAGWIGFALLLGYIGMRLQGGLSWNSLSALTSDTFLRVVFFLPTAADALMMSPFDRSWAEGVAGLGGMLGVIGLGVWSTLAQVGHLYDQSAAKASTSTNLAKLRQSGDTYGVFAEQARKGKLKGGRVTRAIQRRTVRGPLALVWKEFLLQSRIGFGQLLVFGSIAIFIVLMPLATADHSGAAYEEAGTMLALLGVATLMTSIATATSGFIELLRRVDFQKPLPFSPTATVFWEVAAKSVPVLAIGVVTSLAAVGIDPRLWVAGLCAVVMAPSLSLVMSSIALLVILLFPDVDDATQRGSRALVLLTGSAIAALPAVGTAILLFVLQVPLPFVAVPFVAVNLGIAFGICLISGGLYASFNPSE